MEYVAGKRKKMKRRANKIHWSEVKEKEN